MIVFPATALTIIDAGVSVPMATITFDYVDPGDATKTASRTLTRIPWDERYIQGHPDHIDLPVDTFVAVRLSPPQNYNYPLPVWIYGGTTVSFEPILDEFDEPTGTYTITHAGRPGPDLGGNLFPATNPFNISATVALDSPWGELAQSISMGGGISELEQSRSILSAGVAFTVRTGVQWFGRTDYDGNPLVVPIYMSSFTRCARLRSFPGGAKIGGYSNVKIAECRWEAMSRRMTFAAGVPELSRGMYLSRTPGQHGYSLAENQVADLSPGEILLAHEFATMGGSDHAFFGGIEVTDCECASNGRIVTCSSTAGIAIGDEMKWGVYDWDALTWSEDTEVVAEVEKIIDSTTLRLVATPVAYKSTYWAHDGDLVDDGLGTDEALDIGADGYIGDPDGFSVVVS